MNLGIEDAAWLAWLISEGKTDRYTADRWPVGRRVLRTVIPMTRLMSADRIAPAHPASQCTASSGQIPALRRRALQQLTALDTPRPPWLPRTEPA
jgi:2-polyprenyl-6-methoxyphenol hydroxylase-like FAD-dependent oxidoreductase